MVHRQADYTIVILVNASILSKQNHESTSGMEGLVDFELQKWPRFEVGTSGLRFQPSKHYQYANVLVMYRRGVTGYEPQTI
jgi:hypothetical protein